MYVVCLGVYGRGMSQGALAMDSDRVECVVCMVVGPACTHLV